MHCGGIHASYLRSLHDKLRSHCRHLQRLSSVRQHRLAIELKEECGICIIWQHIVSLDIIAHDRVPHCHEVLVGVRPS